MASDLPPSMTSWVDSLVESDFGLREHRFVARDWVSPIRHHVWCEVTDPVKISELTAKLVDARATWWIKGPNGVYPYSAEISYDADERPMLVIIVGIL